MELTLAALCRDLPGLTTGAVGANGDAVIRRVTADSREAGPEVLFVAVRGSAGDGHAFAGAALDAGCPAVIVQDAAAVSDAPAGRVLLAADTRPLPALLARRLAGEPGPRPVHRRGDRHQRQDDDRVPPACAARRAASAAADWSAPSSTTTAPNDARRR